MYRRWRIPDLSSAPGWQAIFVGNFGWVANPLLFLSLFFILMRRWSIAAVCATLGLLLALHSLMLVGERIIAMKEGWPIWCWVGCTVASISGSRASSSPQEDPSGGGGGREVRRKWRQCLSPVYGAPSIDGCDLGSAPVSARGRANCTFTAKAS
jgi:hypothetical protein